MKIHFKDIPEAGLSVDLKEDGRKIEELAGGLNFSFKTPVVSHLDLNLSEGTLQAEGTLKAKLQMSCSRCLKEFEYDVDSFFSVFFVVGAEPESEKELKLSEMEINYIPVPEIDTDEILLAQLSLEVPMQPLCQETCKGLCPRCGADLNQGECGCPREEKTDSKFAKLKDFKVK